MLSLASWTPTVGSLSPSYLFYSIHSVLAFDFVRVQANRSPLLCPALLLLPSAPLSGLPPNTASIESLCGRKAPTRLSACCRTEQRISQGVFSKQLCTLECSNIPAYSHYRDTLRLKLTISTVLPGICFLVVEELDEVVVASGNYSAEVGADPVY